MIIRSMTINDLDEIVNIEDELDIDSLDDINLNLDDTELSNFDFTL